ncbi:MAG TPA: FAD-dependent oxidoreductase [Thermomicrobiaceae bacterium]|nr:FAD-dependent oxidoreductase [Thermomicrobiaceae bacterium]
MAEQPAFDVAIAGAGPAGIAAALAAAASGAHTVLIDEQPEPGGHLRWSIEPAPALREDPAGQPGFRVAAALRQELATSGVETRSATIAWGLFAGNVLGLAGPGGAAELPARAIVVASGSTDIVAPFPGDTLPGVLTARALLIFLHIHRVLPARRFVLLGFERTAELTRAIQLAGADVVARSENASLVRALGDGRLERVRLGDLDVEADGLVLALGRQPDAELALQAQAETRFSLEVGGWVPLRTPRLETSAPGVYVAGEAGGSGSVAESLAEGRLAGLAAAGAPAAAIAAALARLDEVRGPERRALAERLQLKTGVM